MPPIADAVAKRKEMGDEVKYSDNTQFISTEVPPFSIPISGLPVRGVYTPTQSLSTDFINNTMGMRTCYMRSPTFPLLPLPNQTQNSSQPSLALSQGKPSGPSVQTIITAVQAAAQPTPALTMDTIKDGAFFNKTNSVVTDGNGNVDPSTSGFLAKGNIPPTGTVAFTYTSTTTSITWTIPPTIFLSDGTTISTGGGTQAITGLVASTTYHFYPYWSYMTGSVLWVTGGTGSPAYAFTGETATQILQHGQTQILQGNIALSGGPLMAVTPASGSGGGGGGGTAYCVHEDMFVETRRGVIRAKFVEVGDELACPDSGFTTVRFIKLIEHGIWIRIRTHKSGILTVTPTHHITLADGMGRKAEDLGLGTLIQVRSGIDSIDQLSVVREEAHKVKIHCEPEHRYFAGQDLPTLVAHNTQPVS